MDRPEFDKQSGEFYFLEILVFVLGFSQFVLLGWQKPAVVLPANRKFRGTGPKCHNSVNESFALLATAEILYATQSARISTND